MQSAEWRLSTNRVAVGLVCLELLVVGELNVHGATSELSHARCEVSHHGAGRSLVRHLEERLGTEESKYSSF